MKSKCEIVKSYLNKMYLRNEELERGPFEEVGSLDPFQIATEQVRLYGEFH